MPKVPIDKYGNLLLAENKIGLSWEVRRMLLKLYAGGNQQLSQVPFGGGMLSANTRHRATSRLN